VVIVTTHWGEGASREEEENKRFREGKDSTWTFFIKEGVSVERLNPKPSNSPFERNPIDAAEAWNILLGVVDRHASTDAIKIETSGGKAQGAQKRPEELKQEKRRHKLAEAKRTGNVLKIIFYSF
jgi:hypothetical protein